eukprot:CAMPEP_0117544728 /NCGR_PEP_ID=MMETSP0784-20121206/45725_1 /TAXON_ID=39447 /ORGANISM="" /LENGTH=135 /DNA_ID=CAMNT_0005341545 /DNA_START=81 /DNA_END=488 /DNA_ORIENTATION=-
MLRNKELEATLSRDGITNIMLVSDDGSLIAAARSEEIDHTVSAVLASIYNEYKVVERFVHPPDPSKLRSILFDCATARVACTSLVQSTEVTQIFLCVCGDRNTQYSILWAKLEFLRDGLKCLERAFLPTAAASAA